MKRIRRIVVALVVLLALGLLVSGYFLRTYASAPLRTMEGTFTHPSLNGEVTVIRDDWGVPHIRATNAHDAFFAYGFTVAQDRLFQLEVLRRLGRGELSVILGPPAIPTDKISRTLLWRKTAERLLADRSQFSDEFNTVMDAFIEGLNFYVESQPLPVEFAMLGIEPEPFTAVDSLSLMGYMAYGFADGIKSDSIYAIVKVNNPNLDPAWLFPGYKREQPITVMEGRGFDLPPFDADGKRQRGGSHVRIRDNVAGFMDRKPAPSAGLSRLLAQVEASFDIFGGFRGSNSWVLGPSRTKSGEAILANDPHIGFTNPAVWYECHIRYDGYESYGVHLPLIPFPIIGHNATKAWSMTMFENDDLDLYRETFNPANSAEVMYRGEWTRAQRWTESIRVNGGMNEELEITVTPHGPIITGMLKGYEGDPVAIRWLFHDVTPESIEAFFDLSRASSLDEMRGAVSKLIAPGLNISYADKDGNIAWWAGARLPIRPGHASGKDILDGASGKDEIRGFVDFKDNPQLENPASGIIVTSNNMSTVNPVGPIAELEGYWQPTDRAGRILDLLQAKERWSLRELKAVQTDTQLRSAPQLAQRMLDYLRRNSDYHRDMPETAQRAHDAVANWDYNHDVDSVGATVFHYWYDALVEAVAQDEIGKDAFASYLSIADSKNMMKAVLNDETAPLWDDVTTSGRETPEEVVLYAFQRAVEDLQAELGPGPASWAWGKGHTVEYGHILGNLEPLNRIWNIGPFPAPGSEESVAKMAWASGRYNVESGASMRILIDYGQYSDPDGVWFILPTGNSGNVLSRHYDDQAQMYLRGEYRNLRITDKAVDAHAEHTMTLAPEA